MTRKNLTILILFLIVVNLKAQEVRYNYYGEVYNERTGEKIKIQVSDINLKIPKGLDIKVEDNKYFFTFKKIINGLSIRVEKPGYEVWEGSNWGYTPTSQQNYLLINDIRLTPRNAPLVGKTFLFYNKDTKKPIANISYEIVTTGLKEETDNRFLYIENVKNLQPIIFHAKDYEDYEFKKPLLRKRYKIIKIELTPISILYNTRRRSTRKYRQEKKDLLKIVQKIKNRRLTKEENYIMENNIGFDNIRNKAKFSYNIIKGCIYLERQAYDEAKDSFKFARRDSKISTTLDKEILTEIGENEYIEGLNANNAVTWLEEKINNLNQI